MTESRSTKVDLTQLKKLTPREREVLALVGQGLTLQEIAARLFRSLKTIESHRLSIGRKLQAGNRVELARIAIAAGLSPLPASREELEEKVAQRTAELEHSLAEITRREEHYRSLVETMTDGLVILDEHQRITYVNPRFCEMVRRSEQELIGKSAVDLMPEDDARQFQRAQESRINGTLGQYPLNLIRADGCIISVLVSPRSCFDAQGDFDGSFGVVTELKNVEPTKAS